ncbi:COG4223 family protein [Paracoccus fistulariae]|uniref:Mitochondrial inner membrane protein n=1 Tax=Paracoccus fistulariae TaxID=658446 RepID=A0ABY7SNU8_9RHOB|nr:hypothetical protein [Paracoccus fistulariae]MDB6182353.1 hypothetical protein [Paracoccus fistulariae]WCR08669.1 hypothetical protein JHX87_07690 [Paracoccus fistulariae]
MTRTVVKKPEESKPTNKPKRTKPETSAAGGAEAEKKQAAASGAIKSRDVGSGDGSSAAASGAEIKPTPSSLVGDKAQGAPAAAPKSAKPDAKPASEPAKAKTPEKPLNLESAKKTVAKPASTPFEKSPASDSATLAATPTKTETAKPEAAKTEPAKSAPEQPAARKPEPASPAPQQGKVQKVGFWPLVFGGVVAAGIGSIGTIYALPHLPASWLPEQEAPQVDVEAIRSQATQAAEAAATSQIDTLRAELDARHDDMMSQIQANQQQGAPSDGASAEALSSLQQRLDEQAQQIQQLSDRPAFDPQLAQRLQDLTAKAQDLEGQIEKAAQQAQSQIDTAQAEAQKLQEAAEDSTRRAEAVAAIAALQTALDRGLQPDEARQTMESAGIETPAALDREVASLDTLQGEFPDAARAALRASLRDESASGTGNVFTNFLRAQTGARSVEPREGDDPDAILSRADAKVEAGQIGEALTEVEALPDSAKSAPSMAEWIGKATAYRDAQSALSDLSASSN